ncbi:MAG: DUF4186 domain-containing protein [Kiritimatiellae bacterium]|nr:DUF4186 domain-containing protein [Kiritimatiellia bacterium]
MTIEEGFERLSRSKFRSRFRLDESDLACIERSGLEKIRAFAEKIVSERLAMANPPKDGKQTPYRGHPVFKAQHATATCCRGCLNKWWKVQKGIVLSNLQREKIVNLIMAWIERQLAKHLAERLKTTKQTKT